MKTCACGQPKQPETVVCRGCWQASPMELRQSFTAAFDLGRKRELARRLIELARERRPAPQPQPKQAELFSESRRPAALSPRPSAL